MSPAFVAILFAFIFGGGGVYFWSKSLRLGKAVIDWEEPTDYTLLTIMVPKENEKTPIAAEQMFASLHGIFRQGAKVQPHISFEIISKKRAIQFYIYVPKDLKEFVISQVFAQYAEVEVKEIPFDEDYVFTEEQGEIAATELQLKKDTTYPIKTFQNFDVDPLSGITGVLSATKETDQVWIQTLIRPVDDSWQEKGEKMIKEVKEPPKHKGFKELMSEKTLLFIGDFIKHIFVGPPAEPKKEEKKDDKPKELTGGQSQAIKGIEEKITKLGYETQIRIITVSNDQISAKARLEQVAGAYKQFNTLNMNAFQFKDITSDKTALELFKNRAFGETDMIFNVSELASIFHFPSKTVSTPTIAWAGSRKGEPPSNLPFIDTYADGDLTVFAQTNYRNDVKKFGIKQVDRRLHMYTIGKTGTGKSTLMENMIIDDIRRNRGVAVVDPHGETIQHVLDYIPKERVDDVIYFNPADVDYPVGFNLLENVNPEYKNIIASGAVGVFKKIFGESWGPRLEYILRNTILALLDYPGSTLLGIMRILTDNAYRRMVVNSIKDPIVRDFFVNEYEKYEPKFRNEAIAPIQNKVGQFLSASIVRNIVGQPKSTLDIREIMDTGKILLVDLSTGKIGEDNSSLLGSMLITKIQLAAMGRANVPEEERRDFYLYVDEFQNFATDSFATILSEARKYHLSLVMTNQYIDQLNETVANAIFGNVGTLVSFRTGSSDAQKLEKEFEPIFTANDIVNLSNYHIYLKMAIDGVTTRAFSAATLPRPKDMHNLKAEIVDASRKHYSIRREDVEEYVAEWSLPVELNSPRRETPNFEAVGESKKDEIGDREEKTEVVENHHETGESEIEKSEPVGQVQNREAEKEDMEERPARRLPSSIEIVKDRFNRPWYAVGKETEDERQAEKEEAEEEKHIAEEEIVGESESAVKRDEPASAATLASPSGGERDEPASAATLASPSGGERDEPASAEPERDESAFGRDEQKEETENDIQPSLEQGSGEEIAEIEPKEDELITIDQADDIVPSTNADEQITPKNPGDGFEPLEEI